MSKPYVRPDVAAFLAAAEASGAPPLDALPVPVAREAIRAMSSGGDAEPLSLEVVRDFSCPGPGGPIPLRLYDRRASRAGGPLILYFHGGGFVFGDLDSHDPFCRYLADRCDLPVLAVDYRLAPENPFPAFADDAEAVARWVAERPTELGMALTGIVTCGDSAGGHLAILVARQLAARPAALPVIAQWAIYPFVGGGNDWDSIRRLGEGYMVTRATMDWFDGHCGRPDGDPRYSLLLGQPPAGVPLLIQTASLDPLRDPAIAYGEKARAVGAEVRHIEAEGMIHGYVNLLSALPSALADADAFIAAGREMLGQG